MEPNVVFSIGGESMSQVEEYRYLGLNEDIQLNFQSHRQTLINNVNYKLTFFRKIRKYVTLEAGKSIYKGTILPVFEYVDFILDYGIKYVNQKIQVLQNQGLYIVFN